jgi:hypothetical protein
MGVVVAMVMRNQPSVDFCGFGSLAARLNDPLLGPSLFHQKTERRAAPCGPTPREAAGGEAPQQTAGSRTIIAR